MGLVLRRKIGQSVVIGDMMITVSKIEGSTAVKLLFEGPKDQIIERGESIPPGQKLKSVFSGKRQLTY